MDIHYIVNDEVKVADNINSVPRNAGFTWYDFKDFDDEVEELDIDTSDLEQESHRNYLPKFIDYGERQLLISHVIDSELNAQAVNIIISDNTLITYHEGTLHHLIDKEKVLKHTSVDPIDIALVILERSVEQYFDSIYEIEEEILAFEDKHEKDKHNKYLMDDIFELRASLLKIKRVIVPVSEMLIHMKEDAHFINKNRQRSRLKHIHVLVKRQLNIIHSSDEMTDEIRGNYISYNSHRINQIMTILTLISAIFLPLTLITGIYGMNFHYMPELSWHYGYFAVLAVMLLISLLMLLYFKMKKWL